MIKYSREEGGFGVHVNGKLQGIWRVKGWMNNLLKQPERKVGFGNTDKFLITQAEYDGVYKL